MLDSSAGTLLTSEKSKAVNATLFGGKMNSLAMYRCTGMGLALQFPFPLFKLGHCEWQPAAAAAAAAAVLRLFG